MGLETQIEQAAQQPQKVAGDSGSVEMPKLSEMIEADKYVSSKAAVKTGSLGIILKKLRPSGSV